MHSTVVLGALAVASVSAASSNKACSSSIQVSAQSDLDNISSCQTFDGDITFNGAPNLPVATINGVEKITGNLIIKNDTVLTTLNAPSLTQIGESFEVNVATVLSHFGFPQLTKVGSINWVTLPAMSGLNFDSSITNATDITISDTGLTSLQGINVDSVGTFNINNNRFLNEVNVDLTSVSDSLDISFNAQSVSASFPVLAWANNVTFQDVGSISLPNITAVNNSAGFINNTIQGLNLPLLTSVGGSLAIVSNAQLSNASFPKLSQIGGGFQIANNTNLKSILGFPKVQTVGGAIDFIGDFDKASLTSLDLVKGGVDVESSSDKFNCSSWDKAHQDGDIHGDSYVCKAKSSSTSVALTGTATGDSSSASATGSAAKTSSSKGGAININVEYTTPIVGVVLAALFQYI